jgi:hypothetical protein
MLKLEGRQPSINTPPHLAWHLKGIREKEWFWLEEHWKTVRGYKGIRLMNHTNSIDL